MLHNGAMFGIRSKYDAAIERIKAFEPSDGYYLAFSGGKDSQCIYHLSKEAGVSFEAHYHLTTVDPPELVRFIKGQYPDVIIDHPEITMWQLIVDKKRPPTRTVRYCCEALKEGGGRGRTVMTGVRWAESAKRKNSRGMLEINAYTSHKIILNNDNDEARRMAEICPTKGRHILNPIIDWNTEEVWEYLNGNGIPHCSLYDEGFTRIGCIGCPLSGNKGMLRSFERWPKYEKAYRRAFERMLEARRQDGDILTLWTDAQSVMDWWIYSKPSPGWGGGRRTKRPHGVVSMIMRRAASE